ncbi:hypothetical protein [Luteolibacter marinus]|uniref:hypothetical protein n=1 Tax=Luteolibacter marinus TaxID=2776705 RepID=UPI001D01018D|nr:hypothetical protein [Luteolibacter marinus]
MREAAERGAIPFMRRISALGLALLTVSCSLFKEEEAPPGDSETKPVLVGRIALIPPGGDFVLIESYGPWRVPEGGVLSGIGEQGTSSLVVTGEKLGQHAAADIRSGVAKVGDSVYFRPIKDSNEEGNAVESPVPIEPAEEPELQKDDSNVPVTP